MTTLKWDKPLSENITPQQPQFLVVVVVGAHTIQGYTVSKTVNSIGDIGYV